MNTPSFLGHVSARASRRLELVHVDSGAVLASRVAVGEEARPGRKRLAHGQADGGEFVVVSPGSWTHTIFARSPVDVAFVGADGTILRTRRALKPGRAAAARGSHAVIEGRAGFVRRAALGVGDRGALREAQAPRPAREVAPWPSAKEEGGNTARAAAGSPAAGAFWDTDAEADPWDVGSLETPSTPAAAPSAQVPPQPRADAAPGGPADREARARGLNADSPPEAKARRRPAPARGALLAQVIARQTPIDWYEAVAITEGICSALLLDAPASGRGVPDADAVAITPEGGIELLAEGRLDTPSTRLARLLHALTEGAQGQPVQLRLLVLQELSPSPSCASTLEFSTRLALYERPGRASLIRGVYERFQRLPPRDEENVPAIQAASAPAPQPEAWWRRRAVHIAGATALTVLFLAAGSAWLWRAASPPPPGSVDRRGPVARAVSAAGESVSDAAAGSARTVARWFGLVATDRPTAVPAVEAVEAPATPGSTPARRPAARKPVPAAPTPAFGMDSMPPPTTPDTTVYSNVDTEVVPPALVRSRLPADPPPGVRADALPEVEIVVSAAGEVESVKLVTEQAGVLPSMMLSAIKSWRFRPATRDGEPVRYRLRMRLTNR
ncbi:MAG: hypothetical protein R6V57_00045 [Vicinamibacterales bacterium]